MTDLVDQMFPPIHRKWDTEYTDFNYWKTPIQDFPLPEFRPPSPALSARSDTSNQSTLARLRNFSLVGSRQANNMKQFTLPPPATERGNGPKDEDRRDGHLRQMSSLERISSTIASFTSSSTAASPRSASPTFLDSGSDDDDDQESSNDLEKGRKRRQRTRSMTSMPGSLPGSTASDDEFHFDMDEDGEDEGGEEGEYGYEGENEEEDAEQAFYEDMLVAGEMENVPFL